MQNTADDKAGRSITPHLELEIKHIQEKTPLFAESLTAFLRKQDDVTGLQVANLRMMAQSLRMHYEQIDGLLWILDTHDKPTTQVQQNSEYQS